MNPCVDAEEVDAVSAAIGLKRVDAIIDPPRPGLDAPCSVGADVVDENQLEDEIDGVSITMASDVR